MIAKSLAMAKGDYTEIDDVDVDGNVVSIPNTSGGGQKKVHGLSVEIKLIERFEFVEPFPMHAIQNNMAKLTIHEGDATHEDEAPKLPPTKFDMLSSQNKPKVSSFKMRKRRKSEKKPKSVRPQMKSASSTNTPGQSVSLPGLNFEQRIQFQGKAYDGTKDEDTPRSLPDLARSASGSENGGDSASKK